MDAIEMLEDKVMAMEFAFMCLAKALHQQGVLPLPVLAGHLHRGVEHLQLPPEEPGRFLDMQPVAEQLDALRVKLLQLQ